jgi:ABC-type sulfate/molybdate transport systems ATPase subunit
MEPFDAFKVTRMDYRDDLRISSSALCVIFESIFVSHQRNKMLALQTSVLVLDVGCWISIGMVLVDVHVHAANLGDG